MKTQGNSSDNHHTLGRKILGLRTDGTVDVFDKEYSKFVLNHSDKYASILFPVGMYSTAFVDVSPVPFLQRFEYGVISYELTTFSNRIALDYEEYYEEAEEEEYGEKIQKSVIELGSPLALVSVLSDFYKLNSYNARFTLDKDHAPFEEPIFVLRNFKLEIFLDCAEKPLTMELKEKHKNLGPAPDPLPKGIFMISTMIKFVNEMFMDGPHEQLISSPKGTKFPSLCINHKMTKWSTNIADFNFKDRSFIAIDMVTLNMMTFVHYITYKTAMTFEKNGWISICKYTSFHNNDEMVVDMNTHLTTSFIVSASSLDWGSWFATHSVQRYMLHTASDYIEAIMSMRHLIDEAKYMTEMIADPDLTLSNVLIEINYNIISDKPENPIVFTLIDSDDRYLNDVFNGILLRFIHEFEDGGMEEMSLAEGYERYYDPYIEDDDWPF